jgi:VanZ family protein
LPVASLVDRLAGWPALVLWLLVIFGLSSIPNNFEPSDSSIPADKIAHAIEFAVLALIIAWMLLTRMPGVTPVAVVGATVCLASLYGVTDEFHQYVVPGRDVSAPDLAADIVGATVGALCALILHASSRDAREADRRN